MNLMVIGIVGLVSSATPQQPGTPHLIQGTPIRHQLSWPTELAIALPKRDDDIPDKQLLPPDDNGVPLPKVPIRRVPQDGRMPHCVRS